MLHFRLTAASPHKSRHPAIPAKCRWRFYHHYLLIAVVSACEVESILPTGEALNALHRVSHAPCFIYLDVYGQRIPCYNTMSQRVFKKFAKSAAKTLCTGDEGWILSVHMHCSVPHIWSASTKSYFLGLSSIFLNTEFALNRNAEMSSCCWPNLSTLLANSAFHFLMRSSARAWNSFSVPNVSYVIAGRTNWSSVKGRDIEEEEISGARLVQSILHLEKAC